MSGSRRSPLSASVAPCGSGPTQPREAVRAERIGVEVGLHRGGVDPARRRRWWRVARRSRGRGGRRGRRATCRRSGCRSPRPGTSCPRVGTSPGGSHRMPRVVGHLAEPVGLGDPVHVRVLAGEQRGPAGHAGERPGVVAGEGDAVLVEPAAPGAGSRWRQARSSSVSYGGAARSSSVSRMTMSGRVEGSVMVGPFEVRGDPAEHRVGLLRQPLADECWRRAAGAAGARCRSMRSA